MAAELWKSVSQAADRETSMQRQRDLIDYLLTTCRTLVRPEHMAALVHIGTQVEVWSEDTCRNCCAAGPPLWPQQSAAGETRRERFLLRLVVGRFSDLFLVDNALFPRSIVEGFDAYLRRAMGELAYDQLDAESAALLTAINAANDEELWQAIGQNPDWRRWADTIFVRLLFRFGDYDAAKEHMIRVISATTEALSGFEFKAWHFTILFDALFGDVYRSFTLTRNWDALFGDGAEDLLTYVFQTFAHYSLGTLVRYQKVSGHASKFAAIVEGTGGTGQ